MLAACRWKAESAEGKRRCARRTSALGVSEARVWRAGTRVGAQVPAESVTAAAGVATHGALEGFLSGVQFDVAK